MKNTLKIEKEKMQYMETLIKLDKIAGITPIFGIRDKVRKRHSERINELEKIYNIDVRRHIHIGEPPDPNRKRLWEPPLKQTSKSMHFDSDFKNGKITDLSPGELPVFHIDYPYDLKHYVDFIYEMKLQRDIREQD